MVLSQLWLHSTKITEKIMMNDFLHTIELVIPFLEFCCSPIPLQGCQSAQSIDHPRFSAQTTSANPAQAHLRALRTTAPQRNLNSCRPHNHDHDSYCHQLNMAPAFWTIGCIYGATSVALGAFGAHGLKKRIADPARLQNWGTAAQYQVCIHFSNLLLLMLNLPQFNHDPNSTTSRSNSLS
jgi:hypothetical protein